VSAPRECALTFQGASKEKIRAELADLDTWMASFQDLEYSLAQSDVLRPTGRMAVQTSAARERP
jgi:hypothetical protein